MTKRSWYFWSYGANMSLGRLRKTNKSCFTESGECLAEWETNKPPKSWSTQWRCFDTLRGCLCKSTGKLNWWGRRVDPIGLNFGTRWRWGVSFRHRPLYVLGKGPCGPGRPQGWSGLREEETSLALARSWTAVPRTSSPQRSRYGGYATRLQWAFIYSFLFTLGEKQ